jgi:hypothetical protein
MRLGRSIVRILPALGKIAFMTAVYFLAARLTASSSRCYLL